MQLHLRIILQVFFVLVLSALFVLAQLRTECVVFSTLVVVSEHENMVGHTTANL